jgi:murein DD-endopeptidase MepM/ murein hydrolase activator NlpD
MIQIRQSDSSKSLKVFLFIALALGIASPPVSAQNAVVVPGSAWSQQGRLHLTGPEGTTRLGGVSVDLFFGPRTVSTEAGPVTLAGDEFLLLLADHLNQGLVPGTYTVNAKGKPTLRPTIPADPSLNDKLSALLEGGYSATFSGSIDVQRLQLKAVFKVVKGQPTANLSLKSTVVFTGDLNGNPIKLRRGLSYAKASNGSAGNIVNVGTCGKGNYPLQNNSAYVLPYPVGQSHVISQGNCGWSFHGTRAYLYAYDFLMGVGTPVLAARAGTVIRTAFDREGGRFMVIEHDDGTAAWYVHLDDWLVRGGKVSQGEIIALSGNSGTTGKNPGPHLHFDVTFCPDTHIHCGVPVPVTFHNTSSHPFGLEEKKAYTALPW